MKEKHSTYIPSDSWVRVTDQTWDPETKELQVLATSCPLTWADGTEPKLADRYMYGGCSQVIRYGERPAPFNNECAASKSLYFTEMPLLSWKESHLDYRVATGQRGTKYFSQYILDRDVHPVVAYGFPTRAQNLGFKADFLGRQLDPKNIYCELLSGRTRKSTGEADLGGLALQLLELKDMPQLLKTIRGFLTFLRNIRKPASWKVSFSDLAKSYLAVQYGVIPTIGQIEFFFGTLWDAVKNFGTHVQHLRAEAQKARGRYRSFVHCRSPLLVRDPESWKALGEFEKSKQSVRGFQYPRAVLPIPADYLSSTLARDIKEDHKPIVIRRTFTARDEQWDGPGHTAQFVKALTERCKLYTFSYNSEDLMWSMFPIEQIIEMSGIRIVAQLLIDLFQPFQNMWAIYPMSFVYDWFVDFDAVAARFDALLAYWTSGLDSADGVWRGTRINFGYASSFWASVKVSSVVLPTWEDTPDGRLCTALTVEQTYTPGPYDPNTVSVKSMGGKVYERHQVRYGAGDLLLPSWNINLNASKAISLAAIAGQAIKNTKK